MPAHSIALGQRDRRAGAPGPGSVGLRGQAGLRPAGANGVDPFPLRLDLVAAHEQRLVALDEIEQHGYGDCKDLAILLTALLKATGIKAETAWVSRGDVVESLLIPGTSAPNHAIVRHAMRR